MKKQLIRAAATTVLGLSLTTGFAAAGTGSISNTGDSSTNTVTASNSGTQMAQVIAAFAGLLIGGGLAYVGWRAFAAIPEYLQQPAWCQELIVKSKL